MNPTPMQTWETCVAPYIKGYIKQWMVMRNDKVSSVTQLPYMNVVPQQILKVQTPITVDHLTAVLELENGTDYLLCLELVP
jgi:hypothetical protein